MVLAPNFFHQKWLRVVLAMTGNPPVGRMCLLVISVSGLKPDFHVMHSLVADEIFAHEKPSDIVFPPQTLELTPVWVKTIRYDKFTDQVQKFGVSIVYLIFADFIPLREISSLFIQAAHFQSAYSRKKSTSSVPLPYSSFVQFQLETSEQRF